MLTDKAIEWAGEILLLLANTPPDRQAQVIAHALQEAYDAALTPDCCK